LPMRVLGAVALIVLLLQAVLVLAFLAGLYWFGGWLSAVLLCAIVLLLLVLPWMGELAVHFDSAAGNVVAEMSWWGDFTYTWKPKGELCVRVLGIPWRKQMEKREPKRKPRKPRRRARDSVRWGRENSGRLVQVIAAGLQAGHEMLAGAEELSVEVVAPTQIGYADQAIAGAVGSRRLHQFGLSCTADGERQVEIHYRIGLLRATLTGLYMALQSTPWKLAGSTGNEREAEPKGAH
jgi:hypothetical protein